MVLLVCDEILLMSRYCISFAIHYAQFYNNRPNIHLVYMSLGVLRYEIKALLLLLLLKITDTPIPTITKNYTIVLMHFCCMTGSTLFLSNGPHVFPTTGHTVKTVQ